MQIGLFRWTVFVEKKMACAIDSCHWAVKLTFQVLKFLDLDKYNKAAITKLKLVFHKTYFLIIWFESLNVVSQFSYFLNCTLQIQISVIFFWKIDKNLVFQMEVPLNYYKQLIVKLYDNFLHCVTLLSLW